MTTSIATSKTANLVLCGLFSALLAICSYITIPLPISPIPLNLGTLGVFLTGGILGKKYGTVSVAVYIILGLSGIPVFAGFQAGIGVLAGPTGGFILGYLAAVFLIGFILEKYHTFRVSAAELNDRSSHIRIYACAMILGTISCYFFGTVWFVILTNTPVAAAILTCVIPFIPGDIIKIAAAVFLIRKLRPLISYCS